MESRNYIIIPAHFDSKRLPGKVLLEETGKPLIQHSWENAVRAKYKYPEFNFNIIIATDNDEVENRCNDFGAKVIRTGKCENGSERVAEACRYLIFDECFNSVTNYQVDYPELPIDTFPKLVVACSERAKNQNILIHTPAYISNEKHAFLDKDNVKAVLNGDSTARYFSRCPIPFNASEFFIHIGVYCHYYQVMLQYDQIKNAPSPQMVTSENLEQNKWLFGNLKVGVIVSEKVPSINTIEDYNSFVRRYKTLITE